MKSSERHELRRNLLLDMLRNPRELARKYGLPALIILLALGVTIWWVKYAHTARIRKQNQAWQNLSQADESRSEDRIKAIADDSKSDTLIRAWAYIRLGELFYNKAQQPEYFSDRTARIDLFSDAIEAARDALRIGKDQFRIEGQARCLIGLCYENLGQTHEAGLEYEAITSQNERFAGTIWLARAQGRQAFLDRLAKEKAFFTDEPLINLPTITAPAEAD